MKGIVGQLDVVILEARNLGGGTAQRPYCIVQFEKNEFVTKEGEGMNPTWNHGAAFDVSRTDTEFSISVWDRACSEDKKTEDFLGFCSVRPARTENKEQKVWLKLKGRELKNIKGDIQIQFKYNSKENKPLGIEDFQLLKVIGRGNFGKVMQVRKKDTGRIYAMKIIRKEDILKKDEIKHTITERNVLAQNDNSFLVQLKYSFQTPEKLYLVLDFVNGGELFYHLQQEGIFTEERAKFYAAELVVAIEHLHKYNIIYRDIKPENILLDSNGHIAVTDFGLAKVSLSTSTFCGTAEYLAPEILKGETYGKAVDWWSLGILLYEMITGLPPFFSENTNLMYKKILFSELIFPPTVSDNAQSLLRGLINRDPTARLGGGISDGEEIKKHSFFSDISWERLSKKLIPPPFKPTVESETDVGNFDPEFTDELPVDSLPDHSPLSDSVQANFKGFTYVSEEEIGIGQNGSVKYSPRLSLSA